MTEPVLSVHEPKSGRPVRGIALVLHGGRSKSVAPVQARQLAVLRMQPFARTLRRAGADNGLAVAQLRYRVRGWNEAQQSPVGDTLWALDRLAERWPDAPIAIVGHSMGGRAALFAGGHRNVRAVVGLAPWLEQGDPFEQLAGRRVLIVHGTRDRMTNPSTSAAYARAAAAVAESSTYVSVTNERHAMLRRARLWHGLAAGFVLAVVCATPPLGTADDELTNVIVRALAGQAALVV